MLQDLWQPYQHCRLVEPFTGGMAIALGLNPEKALLNDANVHLINFYEQVQIGFRITETLKNDSSFYYEMRDLFNDMIRSNQYKSKKCATLFYYLIRTGFNGLCRFNNKGEFNVPFGQHVVIDYKKTFTPYKKILAPWKMMTKDFESIKLHKNDFLYVDPPYDVEFTKYHREDFKWKDQERLAQWLTKFTGPVVASNQATKRIIELYQDLKFNVYTLKAPRSISCKGDGREPALEILAMRGLEKLPLNLKELHV